MSDDGLEFGAVQETPPSVQVRPDRDPRLAVAVCGRPAPDEPAVFVDLDVWQELIRHACSDTTVELGGVLLGGFHIATDQRPFVVISDSLRAEHYEATRGSFKFTHETWSAITRQREELAPHLAIVGWYHTHPDWGVFLSSLDLFICEHFFGKPLDVALVLDPCRAEWGFFQWTAGGAAPPQRSGGFYLTASRTRHAELVRIAAAFQPSGVASTDGESVMPADPRWNSPALAGTSGPPVVHIHPPANAPGTQAAIWGLVVLQTFMVAFLAWIAWAPQRRAPDPAPVAAAATQSAQLADARREAQAELMNRVLSEIAALPDGSFQQLAELQEDNERLESSLRAFQTRTKELEEQQQRVARQAQSRQHELESKLAQAQSAQDELRKDLTSVRRELDAATSRLRELAPESSEDSAEVAERPWYRSPPGLTAGVAAIAVIAAVGWWWQQRRHAPE